MEKPHHNDWIRQVAAPVSLLGGTAALYQHVLNHPSSSLTPMSVLYMLLLAVHYAIQPRLSKRFIAPSTSTTSVALVEELTKASIAGLLLVTSRQRQILTFIDPSKARSFFSSSLLVAGVPAALYALQNVLQYTSHQHLDSVTFNGLSQTKTLTAALWCYVLLGQVQTSLQMVALGILFVSALLFQRDTGATHTIAKNAGRVSPPAATKSVGPAPQPPQHRFWRGIVPCATATLLSGLAGALSQKGVQTVGGSMGRDAYFYAMEVSLYSALTLLTSRTLWAASSSTNSASERKQETSFWHGWTYQTWFPVVSKAIGGVLTVLVHKYTGAVSKGFALMFGLVLAGVLESMLTHKPMPWSHVLGTLLVMMSGWLHLTQNS